MTVHTGPDSHKDVTRFMNSPVITPLISVCEAGQCFSFFVVLVQMCLADILSRDLGAVSLFISSLALIGNTEKQNTSC